jgi:hypothetical protein
MRKNCDEDEALKIICTVNRKGDAAITMVTGREMGNSFLQVDALASGLAAINLSLDVHYVPSNIVLPKDL